MKPNTILDSEKTESERRTKQSPSSLQKFNNSNPQDSVGKTVGNDADGKKEW